jgi:DNA-directed RNA polymerase subunit B
MDLKNFENKVISKILKKLITKEKLVDHQVSSYNYFVKELLPETVSRVIANTNKELKERGISLTLEKLSFSKTASVNTIEECYLHNLTYSKKLIAKIEVSSEAEDRPKKIELELIDLPVMVGSSLDELSLPGSYQGYFIIKGGQKGIILNEETISNRFFYRTGEYKEETETSYYCSTENYKFLYTLFEASNEYKLVFQPLKVELEIIPLILYLNVKDKEFFDLFSNLEDKELTYRLFDSFISQSKLDIEDILGTRLKISSETEERSKRIGEVIDKYLLPNLGVSEDNRRQKGFFLVEMLKYHLSISKIPNIDLKDYVSYKRLKTVGELFNEKIYFLLQKAFSELGEGITKKLKRKVEVFKSLYKTTKVTSGIISSLLTGSWIGSRVGLNQVLERNNNIGLLSCLRKVINSASKLTKGNIRDVNPSYWGRFCPLETSLSTSCGLLKYLSLGAKVTTWRDKKSLLEFLSKEEALPTEELTRVYVDGVLHLLKGNQKKVEQKIKTFKRKSFGEVDISFYKDKNVYYLDTSLGRILRPVFLLPTTLKDRENLTEYYSKQIDELSIEELVKNEVIEYLEYSEEINKKIALSADKITKEDTYLEISGVLPYGLSASLVPYFNHNAASKTCFGSRMIKQAVSSFEDGIERYDTKKFKLLSGTKPLVYSEVEKLLDQEEYGENLVVAIATLEGRNIEDSIILNKSSVQKGLLNLSYSRSYLKQKFFQDDFYEKVYLPEEKKGAKEYSILDQDGLPRIDEVASEDKIILSRVTFSNSRLGTPEDRDCSLEVTGRPNQRISNIIVSRSESGSLIYRVTTECNIPLEIGEKLASRCGQKGIVSSIIPSYGLPFTKEGIRPDLLFTPHGIFTRMTFGHLLEMIAGKVAALKQMRIPATAFSKVINTEQELRSLLVEAGFNDDGTEVFYDGKTGARIKTRIFSGIIYYMRLYHLAMEKIHSRDYGPVHLLTLQPTEGKSRDGGLRFGEMERDAILGSGCSKIIKDRLDIDTIRVLVCRECKGIVDDKSYVKKCNLCSSPKVCFAEIPYSFYLLRNELFSMGMSINITVEDEQK